MKGTGFALAAFAVVAATASPTYAQQVAYGHDFSRSGLGLGQSCFTCHIPHNANPAVAQAPLWNRFLTSASYTLYTSTTLNAVPGQPNTVSRLCLSCHDGTVALGAFTHMSGDSDLTTDLRGSHPISFVYDAALTELDSDLRDPTSTPSGLGGTISEDLLYQGESMECSSCHDAHNKRGQKASLVKSNAGSALCLTCHNK